MENQQKAHFSIIVFVFLMHFLLFWAVFKGQQIDSDQNITLDYVNLEVDGDSAGSNDAPPVSTPPPPPKVIPQIKRVTPERTYIKPAVVTKTVSHFKIAQQEERPKLQPVVAKNTQVSQSVSNSITSTSSENNTQGNQGDKKEGKSDNPGGKGTGAQNGGGLKVPKEYQGSYLPGLKPVYPQESIDAGEKGRVGISVSVSAEGKPVNVTVSKSSGFSRLDRSASMAVRRHRFIPARRDGVPIPYKYNFYVNFDSRS